MFLLSLFSLNLKYKFLIHFYRSWIAYVISNFYVNLPYRGKALNSLIMWNCSLTHSAVRLKVHSYQARLRQSTGVGASTPSTSVDAVFIIQWQPTRDISRRSYQCTSCSECSSSEWWVPSVPVVDRIKWVIYESTYWSENCRLVIHSQRDDIHQVAVVSRLHIARRCRKVLRWVWNMHKLEASHIIIAV